jgi:hypothetical protein
MTSAEPTYLGIEAFARHMGGVHRSTVVRWIKQGMPALQGGKHDRTLIPWREALAWVECHYRSRAEKAEPFHYFANAIVRTFAGYEYDEDGECHPTWKSRT